MRLWSYLRPSFHGLPVICLGLRSSGYWLEIKQSVAGCPTLQSSTQYRRDNGLADICIGAVYLPCFQVAPEHPEKSGGKEGPRSDVRMAGMDGVEQPPQAFSCSAKPLSHWLRKIPNLRLANRGYSRQAFLFRYFSQSPILKAQRSSESSS